MNETFQMVLDAFTQHIPATGDWMPLAGMVATTLFGLILLLRGAKLAPLLAALTFVGLGGIGGSFLGSWLGVPVWPSIVVTGVLGFIIGLVLFRFWLALLLAGCFCIAALSVYYTQILNPHMAGFTSRGIEDGRWITLPGPEAGTNEAAAAVTQDLSDLWAYLGQNVPNFHASFAAVVLSAGLAGLVFGLLLPKASRALWAASAGTLFLVGGLVALLEVMAPSALGWLVSLGAWGWLIVGMAWAASLVYNLLISREKRPKKPAEDEGEAEAAPA
jgi:hypothetical protein